MTVGLVAHHRQTLTALVFTRSSDTNVTNRRLEFNEGVRLVVGVGRTGFTIGAEISVMTNRALESLANNILRTALPRSAQRAITGDAEMSSTRGGAEGSVSQGFVNGDEAMARVNEASVSNAVRAIVPVRTVETLVTNTSDVFVAAIADSIVQNITSRCQSRRDWGIKYGAFYSSSKAVLGMMTMLVSGKAAFA
jgi:hypothetical protein